MTLDFQQKYYPNNRIGVFHQDFEAQYAATTEYAERTFERIKDSAGYTAPEIEKKLCFQIQNLNRILAQDQGRAWGAGHPGVDR